MNTNPQPDALRSRWTIEGRIPLSGVADGAVWHRARSIATGEGVVLFVVRGEAALEAADAVRRAYLVEDPHLLPVRDIVVLDDPRETSPAQPLTAADDGPVTVVEYPLPPAPPLAALLAEGPLHPETARAVIGEAATGLEAARRRGVRHQFLDSNRVFVDTRSGGVVLLGVGVEAASHPGLDRSRETASFQDTAALVALLYRALTGRSPRHGSDGTVPRPSAVADAPIPQDLDLLCDLVLNESADEIPETTRELIEALQPWQSIPVTLEAYSRTSEDAPAAPEVAPVAAATGIGAGAGIAAGAGTSTEDPSEEELESTALMATVQDESPGEAPEAPEVQDAPTPEPEHLPDEDTVARAPLAGPTSSPQDDAQPDAGAVVVDRIDEDTIARPRSAGIAPVVGAAAVGGGAAVAGAAAPAGSPSAPADSSAVPDSSAAEQEESEPARPEPSEQTAAEAKALVEDLHLDQKRGTSPFPGHLEITAPPEPQPVPEPTPEHPGTPEEGPSAGAVAASGAVTAGAAGAVGALGAARSHEAAAPETTLPSRTSGTHWPLAGADGRTAPLAPGPVEDEAPSQAPQTRAAAPAPITSTPAAAAATPDHSAPTPSQPVLHSATATGSDPVAVGGRTAPVAPVRTDGPIVIQGRDRSLLEDPPEESTVPFARSSLLRDVVGVAVANDAPETFTMGPRDREKRSLQSQWIIIGGAIVVMVALVIALTTITSGLRDILDDPLATSPPAETSAPAEEETGEAPVEPTAEETEEELPAPEIESVELFALPEGAEPDHTDQQDRLTDGTAETYWSTQHYASPDFGGLKEGVGMRLHFAEKSSFSSVTLSTARNNGGTVELRTVNEDGTPGEVLATGDFVADGEVLLEAPEKIETDQVMVWITELPPDSTQNGRFRARIAEIEVG